ncbi:hypothetical protein ABIB25_000769 [Nakamurella sp. UYEF19]|uniref:LacI family DNA-binding transcriptional regulator n=1 Tax=Nakamurella sp. UYEF19 TaxID=1756392 RepID=UPI003390BE46
MPEASRHATVYDVAALAGVSIATVSRFFRDPDTVTPATRDLVRSAVRQLGYVPGASAPAGGSGPMSSRPVNCRGRWSVPTTRVRSVC